MEPSTAIRLLGKGILRSPEPQRWADLGAGDGFFTSALASLIPTGSSVVAVDKDSSSLRALARNLKGVAVTTHIADFTSLTWGEGFDGILMANALHYARDQRDFLAKLRVKLSFGGRLLIVEYERTRANPWVPFPIAFRKLQEVGMSAGFSSIEKLDEADSIYDDATIYSSCLIP